VTATVWFVTHPDVEIDPNIPVTEWRLSSRGQERTAAAATRDWARGLGAIWASTERKAVETAGILATALGVGFATHAALGENDRSATGYLPRAEFEATADLFFAHPDRSIRGWERAVDAQRRIVGAVETVLAATPEGLDVAVVAHGAIGALLICALEGLAITRAQDQPPGGGGHLFPFDRRTRLLRHGWVPFDG
jgi:broad specificity phosphatase PhoE